MELQGIDYRRTFAWTHLFRGFRIALDLRKMALAGLALLLLAAGEWVFAFLPFAPDEARAAHDWPWQIGSRYGLPRPPVSAAGAGGEGLASGAEIVDRPLETLLAWTTQWDLVLRPLRSLMDPAIVLFGVDPQPTWSDIAYAWTRLLWVLCVWGFFGAAITRMAAVQFARDERIGLAAALRFAGRKFLSFLSAPLLPLAGVGLLWLFCLLLGLIGRIPEAGPPIVGALWFLPLVLAFVMALILIGVAVGWPLMYAAISAEGSDAFDGFSRSYSYVYSRPWHYLWYAVVAVTYGSVLIVFVSLAAWLIVHLAGWSVASGMGGERLRALYHLASETLGGPSMLAPAAGEPLTVGGRLAGAWLAVVSLLLSGFVYSYFWSAATIIYFLLRRAEDATELGEVYVPEGAERDDLLPLVGVAASEQPVIERPIRPPGEAEGPAK